MDTAIVKKQAVEELALIEKAGDLALFEKKYLSKQGLIADIFKTLKDLPENKRKATGQQANKLKQELELLLKEKELRLVDAGKMAKESGKDFFDETQPGVMPEVGYLHLITQTQRQAESIFRGMGFELALGPEVETEWYNFDALNVAKDHPARDLQDTFWLKSCKSQFPISNFQFPNKEQKSNPQAQKLLLRTHTSSVQIRYMQSHQPPFRIIAPGRVFRNEATDQRHEAQFYQIEGLMVEKNISAANFKAIIEEFLSRYFEEKVEIRLRPGYFPFVEPGFEIDAKRSNGKWMELMGAGMVHPNVFKAVGIKGFTGFAFGCGLERLAMIKHNIPDLRFFYQSDLRFIKQF
ncbi:phenylalanine--tRNA ligase subunit alpha [Candidatus Gribaldobacteria bacterium]|nr:phenylalanine--tRNA ligase subunit alpha [Candidatus Gribaldobacteria bacterium]